ncbi:MAG: FtsW/RodA/SpoVE family cell cycle protein [Anaerolineae bacterium]|jgi:rod shape determining protein RodA|nr:FtsW/RodA/SpoVE family cell cycle protein [Anaerolineae bacterium]
MGKSIWQYFDWLLLLIVVLLTAAGVAMIYSATLGSESLADTWRNQAIYGALGVVMVFVTAFINYRLLESLQWPLYIAAIGLLILTLFLGSSDIGQVRRFIYIGGISVQPAFPALLLVIISQASALSRNAPNPPGIQEMGLSLGMTVIAAVLVYLQPNLSTATLYVAVWAAVIFTSGIKFAYLGSLGIAGIAAIPVILPLMPDYMQARILNFLQPDRDPWAGYNLEQALISIGSGGLWGKGFASGTQSQLHFLRVRHTDFIFSVICEEMGFIGAGVLLLVFTLLLWRMIRIAANAGDLTGQLIVIGVAMYIFYQLLVNIGMNLSVLPVAGLPMPFISSGGSSLVIAYIGIGLVQSVSMRRKRLEF